MRGVRIERTDGLLGVLCGLEDDRAGSLGATVQSNVDISPDDVASRTEQVLQVLPASLVRQLQACVRWRV